jgi:hypothetical protein
MIDDAIIFLRNRLNRSLRGISGTGPSEDKVEFVSGDQMDPMSFKPEAVSVLLINVEEENTVRAPDLYAGVDANGVRQKVRPEIRLNLLLLFVAQFKEYAHSLTYPRTRASASTTSSSSDLHPRLASRVSSPSLRLAQSSV